MCEPTTDGGACGCSPSTTRPASTRRTCATEGCDRVASGGALNCRTCRAEAPIRRELARREAAHAAEVQAYRDELGGARRLLEPVVGAGVSVRHQARMVADRLAKAAHLIDAATTARDEVIAESGRRGQSLERIRWGLAEATGDHDADAESLAKMVVAALDIVRSELADATAGRTAAMADATRLRADVLEVAQHRDQLEVERTRAIDAADRLEFSLNAERRARLSWESAALVNAADRDTARDDARAAEAKVAGLVAEVDALRLQVRIAAGVALFAGVALVALGVLRGASMLGGAL